MNSQGCKVKLVYCTIKYNNKTIKVKFYGSNRKSKTDLSNTDNIRKIAEAINDIRN